MPVAAFAGENPPGKIGDTVAFVAAVLDHLCEQQEREFILVLHVPGLVFPVDPPDILPVGIVERAVAGVFLDEPVPRFKGKRPAPARFCIEEDVIVDGNILLPCEDPEPVLPYDLVDPDKPGLFERDMDIGKVRVSRNDTHRSARPLHPFGFPDPNRAYRSFGISPYPSTT